ncbi:hypothetical protein AJ80_08262 [Polytolypa hystricis UAMH7299]|uniref:RRM domain-containing protein n=1 Tax=Polytolypa hystricis (strain UAMH7299) TaxID=1447883 RepID=A0A2B7XAP1_POLH7|nr:hypothetical protein AJ80_08262 [Polytolypa hystricis UAMH7299]
MNSIRQIQALNKRELENAVPPNASWHADYRDTAYVYIGGLPYDLSEGDILTIFSQFGEPVHLNLVRDKETGKSKGFAFLKYEDQRSTDLAVDNLTGATVLGRLLRVDHMRYKRKDEEGLVDNVAQMGEGGGREIEEGTGEERRAHRKRRSESESDHEEERRKRRPMLREERELAQLQEEHDDEDPMKEYLIQEKKEEVARALERSKKHRRRDGSKDKSERHRHRHHRHHRRRSEDRSRSRSRDKRSSKYEKRSRSRSRSPERRYRRDRDGRDHRR